MHNEIEKKPKMREMSPVQGDKAFTHRFPHSLHMTKVVMGSSAERVWSWL